VIGDPVVKRNVRPIVEGHHEARVRRIVSLVLDHEAVVLSLVPLAVTRVPIVRRARERVALRVMDLEFAAARTRIPFIARRAVDDVAAHVVFVALERAEVMIERTVFHHHDDEVIDLADRGPADASPHFFSGCAFFVKGAAEEQPETRLGWFTRAEEEFHKALETAPGDWDTKYDFELTTKLASELRKQPNTPPKQLMQLLRPPTAGAKPPRRTG